MLLHIDNPLFTSYDVMGKLSVKNNEVTVQVHYSYAHLPYKMAVYKK